MTNHPGDYRSSIHLSHLREEHLERKSRNHDLVREAGVPTGLRHRFASMLHRLADRLEPPASAGYQSNRYQRVP